jgi:4-amino-4-deoxychorismate lyase
MAAARVPPPFGDGDGDGDDCAEKMKAIILRVAAASGVRDHGQVRYYASAGPGGFALSREECVRSVFYVVVVRKKRRAGAGEKPKRLRVVTTPIPIKPGVFATTKTTNYLPNALVVADAIDKRADVGLWVTENGFVGEGPSMNVAFLVPADDAGGGSGGDDEDETVCGEAFKTNKKWKLVSPPTSNILAGCTVARVAELVNDAKVLEHLNVAAFEFRDVGVEEGKRARETMLIGSGASSFAFTLVPIRPRPRCER